MSTESKKYLGSQQHFEDEINAHYDQQEQYNRDMEKAMGEQPDQRDQYQDEMTALLDENKALRERVAELENALKGVLIVCATPPNKIESLHVDLITIAKQALTPKQ